MATASGLALRAVVAGATGATGKCLVGELLKAKVNSLCGSGSLRAHRVSLYVNSSSE